MQKLIPSCLAIVLTIVLAGCQFETHPGGIYNTDTSNPAPEGSGGSVDKPNDSDGGDSSNGGNGSDGGSSGGEQPQTNTKPVAQFAMQANGLTVSIDASGSTDADNDTLTYKWDIDGDTSRNGKKLDYTFSAGGTKSITLVVNDGKTDSSPIQKSIQLTAPAQNTAPMADFSINVDGMTVTVDASNSSDANGDQLTYQWNFANEASKMGKTASHTFDFEGEQVIRLVVNDGELSSAPLEKTVTVSQPVVEPEPEQDALALIAPAVEKNCLTCHGDKPHPSATINYGFAKSGDEVRQGILTYLTENPDKVQVVKDKPTNPAQNHAGRWPFEGEPNRSNWIAAVELVAQELTDNSGGGETDFGKGVMIFTEDYEAQTVGENPAGWDVMFQYNKTNDPDPNQFSQYIKVSDDQAHTGSKSLYVDGRGLQSSMRLSTKDVTLPNGVERLFVRYYLRSNIYIGNRATNPDGTQPNHNHFMVLEKGANDRKEIRIGEVKGALGVNEYGEDDIVPEYEYWYGKIQTKRIEPDTWTCVETAFLNDGDKPELFTWVDGELVTHIDDHSDFKNKQAKPDWLSDRFGHVGFGWANYGTYDAELYFDDIVVSNERIGCL